MTGLSLEQAVDIYVETLLMLDAMIGPGPFMEVLRQVRTRSVRFRQIDIGTQQTGYSFTWRPHVDGTDIAVGETTLIMKVQLLRQMEPSQADWEAFIKRCDETEIQFMGQTPSPIYKPKVEDSRSWISSWTNTNRSLQQLPSPVSNEVAIVLRRISAWMMANVCRVYAVRPLISQMGGSPLINLALVSDRFKFASDSARARFLARVLQTGEAESVTVSAYTALEYKCNALLLSMGVEIG